MYSLEDYMFDWCKNALQHMKGKKPKDGDYVGDLDTWLYLLHDSENKTVFHVHDSPTCAEVCDWIIIWDKNKYKESIYIGKIWSRKFSDYGKKRTVIVHQPSLKFWKDKKYNIERTNSHSESPAFFDGGLIIKYQKYISDGLKSLPAFREPDKIFHAYTDFKHATANIKYLSALWRTEK